MEPIIKSISAKNILGKSVSTNLVTNKTPELWKSCIPFISGIQHRANSNELISAAIYPKDYYSSFSPINEFTKWAGAEVSSVENQPNELERLEIPDGLYAVFHYKGHPLKGASFFQYIFADWLPNSGYILDERPHFEVLGPKYNNQSEESEEDIYIPIKKL
ncbi:AraC family transcriptional regulator [bacterium]|nr:MAG: AraC family transcriptional regulator [bacterium]